MTAPSTTLRCQYRYDPLDRLVHQTQPDMPIDQRFYCESRLATEIQGSTKHSIIQHDDLLLAQQQREGDALETTLLATDLQRSVLHTLKTGTQPRPIAYSPYGHRPVFSALLSLLGFNGERPDPMTGHYLLGNGYRAFNPVLMRFNSPDSWSPFGKGGINAYVYCDGDPRNRADTTGHSWYSNLIKNIVKTAPHHTYDVDFAHAMHALTKQHKKLSTLTLQTTTPELDLITNAIEHQGEKILKKLSEFETTLKMKPYIGQSVDLERIASSMATRARTSQFITEYSKEITNTDFTISVKQFNKASEYAKNRLHQRFHKPVLYIRTEYKAPTRELSNKTRYLYEDLRKISSTLE